MHCMQAVRQRSLVLEELTAKALYPPDTVVLDYQIWRTAQLALRETQPIRTRIFLSDPKG